MGNSTGSTMYMFGAVIVIYIVGMLIYQGVQWIKKKREQKKTKNSEEVTNSGRYNYSTDRNCFAWVCTERFYQTF